MIDRANRVSVRRLLGNGYSLLEMMIALAVMALAATLVAPGLLASVDAAARRSLLIEIDGQLRAARASAVRESRSVSLEAAALSVPVGWAIELDAPIVFRPDGACTGGRLRFVRPNGRGMERELAPPRCRVSGDG